MTDSSSIANWRNIRSKLVSSESVANRMFCVWLARRLLSLRVSGCQILSAAGSGPMASVNQWQGMKVWLPCCTNS